MKIRGISSIKISCGEIRGEKNPSISIGEYLKRKDTHTFINHHTFCAIYIFIVYIIFIFLSSAKENV